MKLATVLSGQTFIFRSLKEVLAKANELKSGDVLAILEAMKMENEIMAPHDGVVATVHVNKGESVDTGTPIVSLQ